MKLKKLISVMLIGACVCSMAACGSKKEEKKIESADDLKDAKIGVQERRKEDHHGKIAVGFLLPALAERFGDKCSAARADHEADAAQHHDKRHHEVDGCEGRLAGEVRHEEAVYYAVDRREDHHHDRRQHEAQQLLIRKMVRKLNLRIFHLYVQPCSAAIPPFFGYALDRLAFTQPLLQQAAE